MIYIIIGVAMLFILGPIFMMRPSPRERRLARIRQYATAQKVSVNPVSLQKDDKFGRLLERNPHINQHQWFRYQLVAEENQSGPSVKGEWFQRKTKEGPLVWESRDVRQQTPAAVQQMLEQWQEHQSVQFLYVQLGPRSVSIVWNERGDLPEVEALCQQLHELMEA